jgi:hypothetical protein
MAWLSPWDRAFGRQFHGAPHENRTPEQIAYDERQEAELEAITQEVRAMLRVVAMTTLQINTKTGERISNEEWGNRFCLVALAYLKQMKLEEKIGDSSFARLGVETTWLDENTVKAKARFAPMWSLLPIEVEVTLQV